MLLKNCDWFCICLLFCDRFCILLKLCDWFYICLLFCDWSEQVPRLRPLVVFFQGLQFPAFRTFKDKNKHQKINFLNPLKSIQRKGTNFFVLRFRNGARREKAPGAILSLSWTNLIPLELKKYLSTKYLDCSTTRSRSSISFGFRVCWKMF